MDQIVEHDPKTRFFEEGYLHLEDHAGRNSAEDIRARVLDLTHNHDRVALKASEIIAQPALNALKFRCENELFLFSSVGLQLSWRKIQEVQEILTLINDTLDFPLTSQSCCYNFEQAFKNAVDC